MQDRTDIYTVIIILAMTVLCMLLPSGCQPQDREQQAMTKNALATAMQAMEQAKTAQARVDELEERLRSLMKQMTEQKKEVEKAAEASRQSAIDAQDAAERAETSALKCEKILDHSTIK